MSGTDLGYAPTRCWTFLSALPARASTKTATLRSATRSRSALARYQPCDYHSHANSWYCSTQDGYPFFSLSIFVHKGISSSKASQIVKKSAKLIVYLIRPGTAPAVPVQNPVPEAAGPVQD
eukprot:2028888-Rhodomonas_salina.2